MKGVVTAGKPPPCRNWLKAAIHARSRRKLPMNRRMLRQVLECGHGVCDITALRLQPACLEQSDAFDFTKAEAKAVNSLRSAPHSKTLARGTQIQGNKVRKN